MVLQAGRNSAASTDYTKMEEWAKSKHKNQAKKNAVSDNKRIRQRGIKGTE